MYFFQMKTSSFNLKTPFKTSQGDEASGQSMTQIPQTRPQLPEASAAGEEFGEFSATDIAGC